MDQIFVPRQLRQRAKYKGLPIPYATFIGADGTPDFKVVDEHKRMECVKKRLCSLCGAEMGRVVVFIGGPVCVEKQEFFDPASHEECALYAAKACPYLANPNAVYSAAKPKHLEDSGSIIEVVKEVSNVRPAKLALYYTNGYTLARRVAEVGGDTIIHFFVRAHSPIKVDWDTIPQRV